MQCPVCASSDVLPTTNSPTQHTCCNCGTTDATQRFYVGAFNNFEPPREPAPPRALDNGQTLTEFFPPDEIAECARKVENYFKARGAKKWAYAGLRSRDDDDLVSLERVRVVAAAFNCDVVPRMRPEVVAQRAFEELLACHGENTCWCYTKEDGSYQPEPWAEQTPEFRAEFIGLTQQFLKRIGH